MELLTASKLSLWIRRILVALICFNGLVILYVNVPNLFTKSSFIEKVRFNIPLSWQQFQKPPPDGYHELAIEQEKMYQLKDFPRVPEGKILDPDDFKYELYPACLTDGSSHTFYVLSDIRSAASRNLVRKLMFPNSPDRWTTNLLFVISATQQQIDKQDLTIERLQYNDLIVIIKPDNLVRQPEIAAALDHAANCEHNTEGVRRHLVFTTDDYFWFSESVREFFLSDLDHADENVGVIIGNIDFGHMDPVEAGSVLPPKCSAAGCLLSKNTVQSLSNAISTKIYHDNPMTYLSLLAHYVNMQNREMKVPELVIQHHADQRFWNKNSLKNARHGFDCDLLNFPAKFYSIYRRKCE